MRKNVWALFGCVLFVVELSNLVLSSHPSRTEWKPSASGIFANDMFAKDDEASENETIYAILQQVEHWQKDYLQQIPSACLTRRRPFVTVSFAQSCDGKIAKTMVNSGNEVDVESSNMSSSNYPLSGAASLRLTHALRSIHDGILVGGRTLWLDAPRLNNRLWDTAQSPTRTIRFPHYDRQPRPIVLDTNLSYLRKFLQVPSSLSANDDERPHSTWPTWRLAHRPIICCSAQAAFQIAEDFPWLLEIADVLPCQCDTTSLPTPRLNLTSALHQLYTQYGLRSIMVEGGASVIASFLGLGVDTASTLVDCLCLTISPQFVGAGLGLPLKRSKNLVSEGCWPKFIPLGHDAILLSKYEKNCMKSP